ncbi:MAG: DUF3810 domain-containing protein [Chitinophagaceae bacterium]
MKRNKLARLFISIGILFLIAVVIKIISFFSAWIEANYSTNFYPKIGFFLRSITGWIPFSIGDIFYGLIAIWLIIKLIKFIRNIFQKKISWQSFLFGIGKIIQFCLWIYIVFNLLWGLNYDRLGIAYQLQLQPGVYTTEDLKNVTDSLLIKVNFYRKKLGDSTIQYPSYQQIFSETINAYKIVNNNFSFLNYQQRNIKPSLYGKLGNYLGFLGYYNPFTGEAQVNVTTPPFTIPYTCCHEVAHQLGYGTEDEANFVGYLVAKSSSDPLFHYSVYFDLFNYANGTLFYKDSSAARKNYRLLDTLVRRDEMLNRNFYLQYKNPFEPIITAIYGSYLKANRQPKGMETYNEVVAWLIAYQKKYGII